MGKSINCVCSCNQWKKYCLIQGGESSRTTENRYQEDSLTEDFIGNPTRDTLAEGLIGLLTPSIESLDQG